MSASGAASLHVVPTSSYTVSSTAQQPASHRSSHHGNKSVQSQGNRNRNPASLFSCCSCCKPQATNVYVMSCDCVYCPACANKHFHDSNVCPSCGRTLTQEGILELCISAPSPHSKINHTNKAAVEKMLTKTRNDSNYLEHREMASHIMRSMDQNMKNCKILLKQLLVIQSALNRRGLMLKQECQRLQKVYTANVQQAESEKQTNEKALQEKYNENASLNASIAKVQARIQEQDIQLGKFEKQAERRRSRSSHQARGSSYMNRSYEVNARSRHGHQSQQQLRNHSQHSRGHHHQQQEHLRQLLKPHQHAPPTTANKRPKMFSGPMFQTHAQDPPSSCLGNGGGSIGEPQGRPAFVSGASQGSQTSSVGSGKVRNIKSDGHVRHDNRLRRSHSLNNSRSNHHVFAESSSSHNTHQTQHLQRHHSFYHS